jgi:LmbE family N-acetylglucosaminyl deacetylase
VNTLALLPPTDGPTRILCLGAHSDDIEIGCGATLFSWLARSNDVHVRWVVFSAAGSRADEARASADVVLARAARKEVMIHDYRDSYFPSEGAAIKQRFDEVKAGFDPQLIFTHRGNDRHQDHRVVSELTWNTFRNHVILEYEIPKYDGDLGNPNVFHAVDDAARQAKIDVLMKVFSTQRDKRWFSPSTFEGLMRLRGIECASPTGYAEGFHARKIMLDLGSGAGK